MGWGGRRPGAGRKKSPLKVLEGPGFVAPVAVPVEPFEAPKDLEAAARAVWDQQAPHAFANGTLTPATAMAFGRYCQIVLLERAEAASSARSGPNHRGLMKLLNDYEVQFRLAPIGKPMAEPAAEKPQSKLDRFRRSVAG